MLELVERLTPMALDHDGDRIGEGPRRRRVTDRESLESQIDQLRTDLRLMKDSLSDVDRLRFSWKQLVLVVGACVGVVTANYAANAPIRTAVSDIQAQQGLQQSTAEAKAALTEERILTLREKVDKLTQAAELQKMKTDELTNKVLDAMRRVR